jgi:hypothetical protein
LAQKAAVLTRSLLAAKRVSQPLSADLEKAMAHLQAGGPSSNAAASEKTGGNKP